MTIICICCAGINQAYDAGLMNLELRHLRLVRAVADVGTLTRAGETLHLSQSALSHQLTDIESRLGVRLFHRAGRRLELTTAGERLLPEAREILDRVDRAEAAMRTLAGRALPLRIVVERYACYHWLPTVMRVFRQHYDRVEVRIDPNSGVLPRRALLDGGIDLAVVIGAGREAGLLERPLMTDRMALVMPPGHHLARRAAVFGDDYAGAPLFGDEDGRRSTGASAIVSTEALVEFVRAGLGLAIAPAWVVEPYTRQGVVIAKPVQDAPAWAWSVAMRQDDGRPELSEFASGLMNAVS